MKNITAIIDGKKFYLIGAGLILLAVLKVLLDIPLIDNFELMGVVEPGDLFSLGILTLAGRSTIAKFEPKASTPDKKAKK
jgi:hypothetical protein